ncbi:N-acetyl-D-Glu racemase DgcA [Endozoicomonas sp. 4G]|uniref:N-acetyl-D-Glu racemase DgcA n=1 Tax=Endozoicomonas sp. 4G TaxID=2872754 RepID=UPI0020785C79|nr:N-acetyl-D-Glu racemase DgcA [Endozoicomonas sp. 4G]
MLSKISLHYKQSDFPLAQVFRISRGAKTKAEVIEVTLSCAGKVGRAESVPYNRYNETIESVIRQLHNVHNQLNAGIDLQTLLASMSAGSARNALDCAFWDLKAKLAQRSVAALANLEEPADCITAQTLSIDTPEAMAAAAKALDNAPLIKVKLDNQDIAAKIQAIHQASPGSDIIVDANEAWSIEQLVENADVLAKSNVTLIEQPLKAGEDSELLGLELPIALCADESCHTRKDLEYLSGRYQAINIKLDKTGGLTEAIALSKEAKDLGLDIMVGCMVGSSLAMAPAFLLASDAQYVDLDGPLLVAQDREHGFAINKGVMSALNPDLWGGAN